MSSPESPQNPPPEGNPPPAQPAYPQYPPPGQPGYPPPSQPYPPYQQTEQPGYPPPSQPYPPQVQPVYPTPSQPYGQPSSPYPMNPSQPYPQYNQSGQPMPWPVGPDGQPLPWQMGPDGQPLPPQMSPAPQSAATWGQLWPFWGWLVGGGVLALLAVALFATGTDWAAGAQTAGFLLIFGAVVLLATLGIRAAGGLFATTNARRTSQIIGTGLAAVLLLAVAGVGIGGQGALHVAQAHSLEGTKAYQSAINEYRLGGAGAADLARTYNEWGEQLLASGQYTAAIAKFDAVLNTYNGASDQVTRAQKGEAKAYYQVGQQALSAGRYADAVAAFQTLTSKFPNDSSTQQAHEPYAQALLGLGKSQLQGGGNGCTTAATTYRQLADTFSDTPEGQEAATALKAPEPLRGQFTGKITPPSGDVAVALLGTITSNAFNIKGVAAIATGGNFQFAPIAQGTYVFGVGFGTISAGKFTPDFSTQVLLLPDQSGQPAQIPITPLCGTDLGTIPGNISASITPTTHNVSLATSQDADLRLAIPALSAATRWRNVAAVAQH